MVDYFRYGDELEPCLAGGALHYPYSVWEASFPGPYETSSEGFRVKKGRRLFFLPIVGEGPLQMRSLHSRLALPGGGEADLPILKAFVASPGKEGHLALIPRGLS